jgi:hypothetical protein
MCFGRISPQFPVLAQKAMIPFARISASVLLLLANNALSTCGQGTLTFQNLNFEQANVPVVPFGQFGADVTSLDGVPFWTTYIGSNQVFSIFHNNASLGSAAIAILGPDWSSQSILEGSYTVRLQASTAGPSRTAAIGQTGQIPAGTQSLEFFGTGGYTVTFAGQQITLVSLGSTASYTIFGGDISSFAGQTGELRIQGGGLLDNISFSNQAIPEPSMFGIFVLGGLLLNYRCLRGKR